MHRELGHEEVLSIFRVQPEFWQAPFGGRTDGERIAFATDLENSFLRRFVTGDVNVERCRIERHLRSLRCNGFLEWKVRLQQMTRDIADVYDLIRQHDDAGAPNRIPRNRARVTECATVVHDEFVVLLVNNRPSKRLLGSVARQWAARGPGEMRRSA